jgi:hypothetical protein
MVPAMAITAARPPALRLVMVILILSRPTPRGTWGSRPHQGKSGRHA